MPHLRPTLAFAEIIPDCSQVLCDLLELCFQACSCSSTFERTTGQ